MPKEYTLIGGNGTRVSPLEVTESGTYEAGDSRAFNPVKVNVPSGSSTLSGLTDVDISNPADGQTLVYNAESGKWENGSGLSGSDVMAVGLDWDIGEGTLDKTWKEIFDALTDNKIVIIKESGSSYVMFYYVTNAAHYQDSYTVDAMSISGLQLSIDQFASNSADGYPESVPT